ncbi:hypothetical protein Moror_14601 [Moniliophthora roreri MCA 2997]|uniref:Uncharacterized protein n=1 Tax=Moniliophthora roreri (strain MCA 2997) TaxID=1381753 RepID=V2YNI0_MONRO|nr:hypothetical protein Moror_14601 [Moniliophthora roreri MCA 2997]
MHSRIAFALSAVLNAVGAFGASVDPFKCYTLTTGGSNYLDSSDSVLNVENHPNRQALIDDNDKGVSFRFPGGMGGPVVCQAHNDHRVGLANDGKWRTDYGETGWPAKVLDGGSGVIIANPPETRFISGTGGLTEEKFVWDLQEISCMKL